MQNQGFIRVASAVPEVRVADIDFNKEQIQKAVEQAYDEDVQLLALPELSLTGYTCADLFLQPSFIAEAEKALTDLLEATDGLDITYVVGMPYRINNALYNCAVVCWKGAVKGVVVKTYLPNYSEFYEQRWFSSADELKTDTLTINGTQVPVGNRLIFGLRETRFAVEICEDLWVPIPPSSYMAQAGAEIIVNISASDEVACKHSYLKQLISSHSARLLSAYVYSSAGYGESSTDLVFAGNAMVCENGTFIAEGERFAMKSQMVTADVDLLKLAAMRMKMRTFHQCKDMGEVRYVECCTGEAREIEVQRTFDPTPFIPRDNRTMDERCSEIFNIQIQGFAQRYVASHSRCAVIGISGGLDSTLALLVAVRTMDRLGLPRTNVKGITMPGFGTTGRTYNNAVNLVKALGAELSEVSIKDACIQHFKDINLPADDRSVTYENSQARERTQLLMDIANKEGGLVVGTGDLSELALGWATYNGDHMSMYGVNAGVPKTLVRYLVQWVATDGTDSAAAPYLLDIVDTPISPELLPADEAGNIAQKTEDLVGPYELHDFFLYNYVRFGFPPKRLFFMAQKAFDGKYADAVIKKWLIVFMRRFFNQQFKRSALPDGPKVGSVSLSPRGDWRMPSDAQSTLWLREAEEIEV